MSQHLSHQELYAGLSEIAASPQDHGRVEIIVIRPDVNERQSLDTCYFSPEFGAEGDSWRQRYQDEGEHPEIDAQIAVMNIRSALLVARTKQRCQLAGDNLFVDLDLSGKNLHPGQRLSIGSVLFEVTAQSHDGCKKFAQRFGTEAVRFVNSEKGKYYHLRGIYLKVLQTGTVKVADLIQKCATK